MKKSALTLFLALAILIGVLPIAAAAADDEYETECVYETGAAERAAPEEDPETQKLIYGQPVRSVNSWSGSGTKADPYQLASSADIAELRNNVNAGTNYSGTYFVMTANITLPTSWTPIGGLAAGATNGGNGVNIRPFSGNFDGGGYTITVPYGERPLFGYVRKATIKNLNIYGTRINGCGVVENYTVDYGASGNYTGQITAATFSNVILKSGTQTLKSGFIGGDVGTVVSQASGQNPVTFNYCIVESGVTIGYDGLQSCIGSFAGRFNGTMIGCESSAAVYGVNYVGGLVGVKDHYWGICKILGGQFHGTVTGTGDYVGGIAGAGYCHDNAPNAYGTEIENCLCDGTVAGANKVGGILGGEGGIWQCWEEGAEQLRDNTFTGTISSSGQYVGSIVGYARNLNKNNIILRNYYSVNNGATTAIGGAACVDSGIYADNSVKPMGLANGVYRYDSAEDSQEQIKYDLDHGGIGKKVYRKDQNRQDDPLGTDALSLNYTNSPSSSGTATVSGVSLNLGGQTTVIFYVDPPSTAVNSRLSRWKDELEPTERAMTTSASYYNPDTGEYRLRYTGISACEYTQPVVLRILDSSGQALQIQRTGTSPFVNNYYSYCPADWANAVIENPDSSTAAKDMAKALLNYGECAQKYFAYNLQHLANPNGYLAAEMAAVTPDSTYDAVIPAAAVNTLGYSSASLVLRGVVGIRLYFSAPVTATDGTTAYNVVQKGDQWYVEIPNISIKDFDKMHTVVVSDSNNNSSTIQFSVLSYANKILNNSASYTEDVIDMCRALYLVNSAANTFFG